MKSIRKGMTLIEVLVGIAILGGTGTLLLGFLYRNPMTQQAYTENYGNQLSQTHLYRLWASKNPQDTSLYSKDSLGVEWMTLINVTKDGKEQCISATSVRQKKDTTRTLNFCLYE